MRLGAIEAGGTKFVCGIGTEQGEVIERISIPTTTPEETLGQVIDFLKRKRLMRLEWVHSDQLILIRQAQRMAISQALQKILESIQLSRRTEKAF